MGRRGGSNEYPQSVFWSTNSKDMYTPVYPSFFFIKEGFKGIYLTQTCFRDVLNFVPISDFVTEIYLTLSLRFNKIMQPSIS